MKPILLTLEFPPFKGGVANYYGQMIKYWPTPDKPLVWQKKCRSQILKYFFYFINLWWKYKTRQFDYILVGQILPLGTVAWMLAGFFKIKYSVFLHGLDFSLATKNKWKSWLSRRILSQAHYIISANHYTAELVIKFNSTYQSKTKVVNPGIEDLNLKELIKKDWQPSINVDNKTIVLSLGRLVKRKGFEQVIKSLDYLQPEARAQILYIIAGEGPEIENLKSLAKDYPEVIILGALTESDKWSWLNLCDIFIMPALNLQGDFEGFGIVYLEANLLNKPVVAGLAGGVPDAVENGVNGLLVNPESLPEIATALNKLITTPNLRSQLGCTGRQRALEDFNWSKQSRLIYQIINQ